MFPIPSLCFVQGSAHRSESSDFKTTRARLAAASAHSALLQEDLLARSPECNARDGAEQTGINGQVLILANSAERPGMLVNISKYIYNALNKTSLLPGFPDI